MKKRLTLTLSALTITLTAWCQFTVTGTVISADYKSPIPGVSIVEKGTANGTTTQADGRFSIVVKNAQSILQLYFIGFITKEVPVNGRDSITIKLEEDCIRDWFDAQRIGIFLNSGVINNPVGAKFEIAFPGYFRKGTLTSSISYQTNLDQNRFINGDLKLNHFIFKCDFDMGAAWYYRTFQFGDLNSTANSLETNINLNRVGFIAGVSRLVYTPTRNKYTFNGPVVGFRLNGPWRLAISGKTAIYKNQQEYFGEVSRSSRYVDVFIKYYQLDTFAEVSLGIGTTFGYWFRKHKGVKPQQHISFLNPARQTRNL